MLTNLGLSYALTKQLPLAEDALRQACANPHADARMRNNFALILALEGKFAEAEQVSRQDMSAQAASANVQAIRQMIAQNDSWRDLQTGAKVNRPKKSSGPAAAPLAPDQPAG